MIDSRKLRMFSVLIIVIICTPAMAQKDNGAEANVDEEKIQDDGIKGLIVDNTVTFIGRDFYDAFALAWLDQRVGDIDNLSINERPTARSGSRVWVEYNRQSLFQVFLSPVRANIEATARNAASSVARRVEELSIERLLFKNPDLAPDEL
ncbi:MAG: CsgE family curli-type amyloid fiber assembly protein [Pseudomonadota bacterium]